MFFSNFINKKINKFNLKKKKQPINTSLNNLKTKR